MMVTTDVGMADVSDQAWFVIDTITVGMDLMKSTVVSALSCSKEVINCM